MEKMGNSIGETKAFEAAKMGDLAGLEALAREEGTGKLLNAVDDNQCTLLHCAAFSGQEEVIRWLLRGRAFGFTKVLARDARDMTALHYAAMYGRLACCQAIVEGCKEENGERKEMLNALINDGGDSLLRFPLWNRHDNIIRWLLSNEEGGGRALGFRSENITLVDKNSESALHEGIVSGSTACVEALLSGCTSGERIKLFLAVDKLGLTPLHLAAQRRNLENIRDILQYEEAKIIVNDRDHRGMTVLHLLASGESAVGMNPFRHPPPIEDVARTLLGLDPTAAATVAEFIDVNAGLMIPEEVKAAAGEEKEKRREEEEESSFQGSK